MRTALAETHRILDRLEISTSSDVVLVTIPVSFPAASSGAVTVDPAAATAAASGTAAKARLYKNGSTEEIAGLVVTAPGAGGHVQLTTTSITSGQPVDLSTVTLTVPASY